MGVKIQEIQSTHKMFLTFTFAAILNRPPYLADRTYLENIVLNNTFDTLHLHDKSQAFVHKYRISFLTDVYKCHLHGRTQRVVESN